MMKCMVLHNEGVICIFLLIATSISCSFVGENFQTIQELCASNRYIYSLQPGESHQVRLTSEDSGGRELTKWYQKYKRRCRKEFKANNGASHFQIVVSNMSIPSCSEKCQCNYFEITEPGRDEKFCGKIRKDLYFESKHDYLAIEIQHGMSMQFDVTLTFTVERNAYIITGAPKHGSLSSGHFLETPYFPNSYPSDYIAEYVLQSDDPTGHVMLMFLDFQIAPESFVELVGHNGTHPERFDGSVFRPRVIVSQQQQLSFKFEANKQARSGFRAVCFFVRDADLPSVKPFTRCGGVKDGYGGVLSLDLTAKQNYYDCLWLILPPVLLQSQPYFLSVSNLSLENLGPEASLEFREGLNSKSRLVKSLNCAQSNCSVTTEITVPASRGLYIRFNGLLRHDAVVRMVYLTYHSGNCSEAEAPCNDRCLLPALRCDGVAHCADGNDEQGCTTPPIPQSTPPAVSKKRLHSSNTAASFLVILSIGGCGVLFVLAVVALLIYRRFKMAPLANIQVAPESPVDSEMQGSVTRLFARPMPYCDQPPSYDDFIRASDCYPPLLYTRAAKRHSEPFGTYLHTTSFCGKQDPSTHPSTRSFDLHSLSSSNYSDKTIGEDSASVHQPGCSFSRCSGLSICTGGRKQTSCSLKKAASYESKLDKSSLHLSITHSMCHEGGRPCVLKHNSLPTRLTIKDGKPNEIDIVFQTVIPGDLKCSKERHFSSSFVCRDSVTIRSEIMTTVKTRCYSDPCSGNPYASQ